MISLVGKNLTAGYGGVDIIKNITLEVKQGEIAVIVGPNGAGKSTAMKALLGMLKLTDGSVSFAEDDISNMLPQDRVNLGIAFVPQTNNVFTGMSVEENLEMGGFIRTDDIHHTIEDIYNLFPVLKEKRNQNAGELSGGQRQQVAFGRALMTKPKILMLDEPTAGVSPIVMDELFSRIIEVGKTGVGILMVEQNAKQALTQKLIQSDTNNNLIEKLATKFKLNNNIDLIEVYDNSHIQGTDSIGALICFSNDGFIKKRYRKFNIKNETIKNDDYGMMKEVLFRRFSKAIKEKAGSLSLPDLILIDGGKGQYSVSREVLNELGLHDLPIIAVAKGKKRNAGEEKIYHENKEYILNRNDPLLFFIQRLRDEAHRFAISTHRAKRKKNLSKSLLDQIQGIGKQRKRALLNHFGSARAVESASLEDLKSIEGIEDNIANKIYNYFHE